MEANEPITPISEWKKQEGIRFQVPSGNTCLLRKDALHAFMRNGKIPNVLVPIVLASMGMADEDEEKELENIEDKKEFIPGLLEMIDSIVVVCVIEPRVHAIPVCPVCEGTKVVDDLACKQCMASGEWPDRDDGKLYVDDVDFDDRVAISNEVLGDAALLTTFRQQQARDVVSVPNITDVVEQTFPTSTNRG